MPRLIAFSFFVCAAFAWVPPFLDRAGLAALGFAFLVVSVGRVEGVPRPSKLALGLRPEGGELDELDALGSQIREQLAAYGLRGGNAATGGQVSP